MNSKTNIMQKLLDRNQNADIQIVSGEGEEGIAAEYYDDQRSVSAILDRLRQERCGADRWARAVIYEGENIDGAPFGIDLESGELRNWV